MVIDTLLSPWIEVVIVRKNRCKKDATKLLRVLRKGGSDHELVSEPDHREDVLRMARVGLELPT